ncbi:MAG: mevalonate kinase [Candidatus Diapherotrites archaeon]|nr:mevalonate kinase [Candidatus Diapherotrites archaeon]
MNSGKGFGKTILFGDHFVVYGHPGIASAINDYAETVIEDSDKFEFIDNRPATQGYKEKKKNEIQRQLNSLMNFFELNENSKIKITVSGNLKCASGVGASAALAASIARALNEKFKKNFDDEKINEIAFKAEEAGSGPASGIDNTCAVYGGMISFTKNLEGGKNKIELIESKECEIVLANSGITQETKVVVGEVKKWKESHPEKFSELEKKYLKIYEKGLNALKEGNWKELGKLMNEKHELLKQLTVSCDKLNEMQKIALNAGAFGAKLTGTGRGGLLLCLTPGKELQEKTAKAFEEKGIETRKTKIGVKA